MTKKEERELLEKLKHKDTYFSEAFDSVEIDLMCNNIKHDFPILMGTKNLVEYDRVVKWMKWYRRVLGNTIHSLKNTRKLVKIWEHDMGVLQVDMNRMILVLAENNQSALDTLIGHEQIKMEKVVQIKVKNNIDLTVKEKECLIKMINFI